MRTVILAMGGVTASKYPAQDGFKMDFEITGTRDRQTDWNTARAWNLKRDTEALVKAGVYVSVTAGFKSNVGLVGDGYVDRAQRMRRGNDRLLEMRFSYRNPGQPQLLPVERSGGTRTDVPAREVFQSYAAEYARPITGLDLIPENIAFPGRYLPDPQTPDQGMAQALDRVRTKTEGEIDLDFVVQPRRILVLDRNPRTAARAVSVSRDTGMIGSPKVVDMGQDIEGVAVEMVLDPRVGLDSHIQLTSRYVRSGLYAVQSYKHRGDSYDGIFRTSVTGVWIEPG